MIKIKESKKFIKLQKELLFHKYNYYILDKSVISDYEYDMLERSSYSMAKELGFKADRFDNPEENEKHHIHWMIGYNENNRYESKINKTER